MNKEVMREVEFAILKRGAGDGGFWYTEMVEVPASMDLDKVESNVADQLWEVFHKFNMRDEIAGILLQYIEGDAAIIDRLIDEAHETICWAEHEDINTLIEATTEDPDLRLTSDGKTIRIHGPGYTIASPIGEDGKYDPNNWDVETIWNEKQ